MFVHWTRPSSSPLADEPDPAVRLIMRMYAYWGLQRLSPDLLGLARAEALQEDAGTRAAVQEAQRIITADPPGPRGPAPRSQRPAGPRRAHRL